MNATAIKIAVCVGLLALYGWLSYDYGATSVQSDWNAERARLNANTAKALSKVNADAAKLSDELETEREKKAQVREVMKTQTVEVEKEVFKYVTKYRDNECRLDNDWLRVYSESVARTKATASAAK
ncbi:hypothetical protein [Shewanella sp.]|uniref:hypothetical protein n=1 Tax=Shewanella sp. TaxID=50422 RepID=UPI001B5EA2E9|nr:hypothetical protein [Shewanella sp.]MBP6517892.1 hypothetical protein [Shewanella sp.]